jgi:DNA polymerase-4
VTEIRSILHVDMDAFFAAIEQRDHPELRGRPLLVGGTGRRGVISTASYEARVFGCHSAQPTSVALRLCPEAVIVPPDGKRYHAVSERLFALFHDIAPVVEPLSVDEAFLDLSGTERLLGPAEKVAGVIKARVREELQLTASVGVSHNKFLAKLASDLEKPDGLTVIGPEDVDRILPPLPIERLWGVGAVTAQRFHAHGIRTIGDLRGWSVRDLTGTFGRSGEHFHRLAHGQDVRPVVTDTGAKSISQERTFPVDIVEPAYVREVLRGQVEQVSRRLRRGGLRARTVSLKIRYGDFETISRSSTLKEASDVTAGLMEVALTLFDRWSRQGFRPVRLIGMGTSQLEGASDVQLGLFPDAADQRNKKVDQVLDAIQERFGGGAIQRGGGTPPPRGDGLDGI